MDPTAKAIHNFQEEFRSFREEANCRLLLILCDPAHTGTLIQLLRAEEWNLANQSPFLVFDNSYTDDRNGYKTMSATLIEHYDLLRKGLAKQNIALPEWDLPLTGGEDQFTRFVLHLQTFYRSLRDPLQGLWVCWLPASVKNGEQWWKDLQTLFNLLVAPNIRFIISDEKGGPAEASVAELGDLVRTIPFSIDEKEMMNYFKKLSTPSSASKPHPGTMPGAARPDVEPPPRPHSAKQPTEEDLLKAIQAGKVSPVLLPSQGAKLRQLVLDAATAISEKRPDDAMKWQQEACLLCKEAGVKVEQALMTLILASYCAQSNLPELAARRFLEAATLAEEAHAYPQVAQARMALAYFLLRAALPAQAAQQYELAGEAALKGQATMLRIDAFRMSGTCYLQCGRKQDAVRCWQMVVMTGQTATADEIRNSRFKEVCESLIKLLREQKLEDEARRTETLISQVSEKLQPSNQEPKS